MSGKVLRWLRVVATGVITAAVPVTVFDYVLTNHALSNGRSETRSLAERYVEQAEAAIAESLSALRSLKARGVTSCTMPDRRVYGETAFQSRMIQQVGVVQADGVMLCGEPMGTLTQPVRLPTADKGDPSVMIGILTDGRDDRQAIVTLRTGGSERLVARIRRGTMDLKAGAGFLVEQAEVGVFLEDGSEWLLERGSAAALPEQEAIIETVSSQRYPLKVTATSSRAAAIALVAPLRTIILVVSTFGGFVVFVLALWAEWRRDSGDSFSRAVAGREFLPYYQPVFDIFTGEVKGCEVLVRWQRPDGSMVPPGQFLPYAEATGLIRDITRHLMEQTVEDCAAIYATNPQLKLSINLTAMHFNDLEIIEEIREIYSGSGIRYEQLCFEVTEQNPLKDLTLSRTIIGRIQDLGAAVALDDVGTGHGGLAYLQKLGVDIIKIDKMFVDNIATDHSSQTIVDTLVELGTQLGLGIIAEGVEREDQAEHLRSIGVSTAQGYLYSKPLPAADYLALLNEKLADQPVSTGGDGIASMLPRTSIAQETHTGPAEAEPARAVA